MISVIIRIAIPSSNYLKRPFSKAETRRSCYTHPRIDYHFGFDLLGLGYPHEHLRHRDRDEWVRSALLNEFLVIFLFKIIVTELSYREYSWLVANLPVDVHHVHWVEIRHRRFYCLTPSSRTSSDERV